MKCQEGIVVCIGNPLRGDDAAGLLVCKKLNGKIGKSVDIVEMSGDLFTLTEILRDKLWAIIVDVIYTEWKPFRGNIHRITGFNGLKASLTNLMSTHEIDLITVLALVKFVNPHLPEIILYVIEGENFSLGESVSREVLIAVNKVVKLIETDVRKLCASGFNRNKRPFIG